MSGRQFPSVKGWRPGASPYADRGEDEILRPRVTGDAIVEALRKSGPTGTVVLAERLGIKRTNCHTLLNRLRKAGKVTCRPATKEDTTTLERRIKGRSIQYVWSVTDGND